jgi:hypothetical protein
MLPNKLASNGLKNSAVPSNILPIQLDSTDSLNDTDDSDSNKGDR